MSVCFVGETRSQPHLVASVKEQEVKANLTKIVKFKVEHIGSEDAPALWRGGARVRAEPFSLTARTQVACPVVLCQANT